MAAAFAGLAHGGGLEDDEEVIDVPNAEGVAAGYTYEEEEEDVGAVVVEDAPLLTADGVASRSTSGSGVEGQGYAEQRGAAYAASETGAVEAMATPAAPVAPTPRPEVHTVADNVEVIEIPNRTGTPLKMSRAAGRVAGAPAAAEAASGTATVASSTKQLEGNAASPVFVAYGDVDEDDRGDDDWGNTEVPGVVSVEEAMAANPMKVATPEQDWEEIAARVRSHLPSRCTFPAPSCSPSVISLSVHTLHRKTKPPLRLKQRQKQRRGQSRRL
jgi:hypothetical protein